MRQVTGAALVVFALDQASKIGVVFGLNLIERGEIDVLPPFLNFRMAWNTGINFGLLSGHTDLTRWGLIVLALGISVWVWSWTARQAHGPWARLSAGILIGGALGNVVDRVAYGAVADFLNMSCCGFENPYAFNVADIAIFIGAAGLVLFTADAKPGGGKPGVAKAKPKGRKTP